MNRTVHSGSKCVLIAVVMSAFLLSGDLPLMACPPQSGQSTTSQATGNALPETPQPQSAQAQQEPTQAPSGAAGAKATPPRGTPAAEPVGAAVAPARQRGHRSLLIKVGLLAGAGIAVGTVIALSAKSPTRPPGAPASTHP